MADPGVEPDRRLVEEEHSRRRHERSGDLEPPPLAAAVARDRSFENLREPERADDLADPPARRRRRDIPEARVDLEVAPAAQRAVHDRLLEHDAAHPAGSGRVGHDIDAVEPRAAAGRLDRGRQHAHGRGLAGPVLAEQAEDLARGDLEVKALDGLHAAGIGLSKPLDRDRGDGESGYLVHGGLLGHIACVWSVTPMTNREKGM